MPNTGIDGETLTVVASVAAVRHTVAVPKENRGQIDNVLLLAVLAAGAKYNIGLQSNGIQQRIAKALGDRVKKYLYRTLIK